MPDHWIKWIAAELLVLCAVLSLPSFAAAQTFDVKQVDVKKGALELGLDNTVQAGVPRPMTRASITASPTGGGFPAC